MKQDQEGKMESKEKEEISEAGDTVEEGEEVEDIYHDAVKEEGKEENAGTKKEKEGVDADKGRSRGGEENRASFTSTRPSNNNDVTRKNGGDEGKAIRAGTSVLIRRRSVEKGLVKHK